MLEADADLAPAANEGPQYADSGMDLLSPAAEPEAGDVSVAAGGSIFDIDPAELQAPDQGGSATTKAMAAAVLSAYRSL